MSQKNKLQEYYQKRGLNLPVYDTKRHGGKDHHPLWISTVNVGDNEFSSKPHKKKGKAEQEAAELALQFISGKNEKIVQVETKEEIFFLHPNWKEKLSWCNKIFLIDLENCPHAAKLNCPDSTLMIGVVGHCHPLATQSLPFAKSVINSAMKDAADHALTFLVGYLSTDLTNSHEVYIVSRDHYAEITVACLKEMGINATHLPQLSQQQLFSLS